MDNEYINRDLTENNTPQAYQYPPANQSPAYPEYQQPTYTPPAQPAYDAPYGQHTAQPSAQTPYGGYNQTPPQVPCGEYNQQPPYGAYDQNPYGGYNQAPYGAYGQPPYPAPTAPQPPKSAGVLATLGMVFGIIGVALFWFPVIDIFSMLLSIVGIPFSAIGLKSQSGKAVAGLVMSIIGTILGFVFVSCYSSSGVF